MTTTNKFTRQQRLNDECTHEEYYNQFVTDSVKDAVLRRFSKDRLIAAFKKDKNLNSISLPAWDSIAYGFQYEVSQKMRDVNDFWSLKGGVCIAKNAARQIVQS